jgi:hypothetical protein
MCHSRPGSVTSHHGDARGLLRDAGFRQGCFAAIVVVFKQEIAVKKIVLLVILCVAAVGFGFGAREPSPRVLAQPSLVGDRGVVEPQSELTLTPAADLGAADDCGGELTTQDAASCRDGGWAFVGCCAGGIPHSRWQKGAAVKCCGACMQ